MSFQKMASGHHQRHDLSRSEIDDLLAEALSTPKIKTRLVKPFKVDIKHDIPLLGSSSVSGAMVYIDRHLHHDGLPFGFLIVDGRKLNTRNGLVRHERLEKACEDILGWPYKISHPVATAFEEKDYLWRGFNPRAVERAYAPFIKNDEKEPLTEIPLDLDLRPVLGDPKLLERILAAQDVQKRPHEVVKYVPQSEMKNQQCSNCVMFVSEKFGGPSCTITKNPISPRGWCRRYFRGFLENS